jgi:hypothetical protein
VLDVSRRAHPSAPDLFRSGCLQRITIPHPPAARGSANCLVGRSTEHRTDRPHDCDKRCRQHECQPMADASISQFYGALSGAMKPPK